MISRTPVALAAAAGLAACTAAHAQTLSWNNAAGGSAAVAGNWNPAQIPGAANPLNWNLSATYPVTFTAATAASQSQLFSRGRVTLTMTSTHTVGAGGIIVGDVNGDNAQTTLTTGTWNSSGPVTVARNPGSLGVLTVNDADADLVHTAPGFFIVGDRGNGTLNVVNLGRVSVADRLFAAANTGSTATVVVDGAQSTPPFTRSTLEVLGTSTSAVGGGGNATLRVDNGALASFAGDVVAGGGSVSVATITVEDQGLVPSRLNIAGDLNLGRNTSAGGPAGNASLLVNTAGSVVVGGTIHLGDDPDGGTGLLRLTGAASSVTCGGLARGPGGTVDLQDGQLTVDGGPFTTPSASLFQFNGGTVGASPTILLRQNATMTTPDGFQLAVSGNALVRVESGSRLSCPQNLTLGVNAGSRGQLTLTGPSTTADVNIFRVGSDGDATLEILDRAALSVQSRTELAALPGSSAEVTVDHATADFGTGLFVSARPNGAGGFNTGGRARLTLANHASATTSGGLSAGPLGEIVLDRSSLTFGGHGFVAGSVTLVQASLTGPSLEVYGPFSASGTIRCRLFSGTPILATGDLTVGDGSADALRFLTVDAGPFRVTYLDSTPVELRSTSVNGGSLIAANGFTLLPGEQLAGTGRIVGDFRHDGNLIPTGPLGLSFLGTFDHDSGRTINGTRILFEAGSLYRGHTLSGSVRWHVAPGSRMVFTETSAVGLNVPDGFVCGGELDISGNLLLGDSDGFSLGSLTTLRGGSINTFQPVRIDRDGNTRDRLQGTGAVNAAVVNTGVIAPGLEDADRTSPLVFGALSMTDSLSTGIIEVQIEGPAPDQADLVDVTHGLTLDGTLVLQVLEPFSPANGFRRTIVSAATIAGDFSRLELPPRWHLERVQNHLDAVYCAADFNQDSFVDFFDYDDFVNCFETASCPEGVTADFNQDGFADFFDYDDFVTAFEQGC